MAAKPVTPDSTPRKTMQTPATHTTSSAPVKTAAPLAKGGILGGGHAGGNSDVAKNAAAEQMLKRDMAAGKVKDLDAERQMIFKKTGGYANGYTN